jgi:hypothetical protein
MATFNFASSTNNVNQVLWSWSTKIELRTDRPTSAHNLHDAVDSVENLGVGVSAGEPFTILA